MTDELDFSANTELDQSTKKTKKTKRTKRKKNPSLEDLFREQLMKNIDKLDLSPVFEEEQE